MRDRGEQKIISSREKEFEIMCQAMAFGQTCE